MCLACHEYFDPIYEHMIFLCESNAKVQHEMLVKIWTNFCDDVYICLPRMDEESLLDAFLGKVSKGANIRNRYNQVPHLTQDTNGKVTNSQLDTTNESQEVSPFLAGDHNAQINRHAQRHNKQVTEKKKIHKKVLP